jgi:hypothetical protein
MRNETIYRDYTIYFQCGYYWITGSKMPHSTIREAKDIIDFWLDEELAYAD